MKSVLILYSLLFVSMASANPMDSLRSEQRADGLVVIHEVEEEETIYSIAKRYGGSVSGIIQLNELEDNRIEIGQIIEILVIDKDLTLSKDTTIVPGQDGVHEVQPGETLYSISRDYNVKLRELKKWNDLKNNSISPGMRLRVAEDAASPLKTEEVVNQSQVSDSLEVNSGTPKLFIDYDKYLVQTGETLYTIASRIGVAIDSLRIWNGLQSDYLKIGQELLYRGVKSDSVITVLEPTTSGTTRIDENGFEKIYEEGVASVIESMNTSRYLALHRTLPIGTNLEVRNLMNNQVVHVKVVGKLPDTGLNKNLMLRLSKSAYEQLGILDPKARVEVSYFKE